MDERVWTDRPIAVREVLDLGAAQITRCAIESAVLVSGNLDAARKAISPDAPVVGLIGQTDDAPHIIQIARDRALFIAPVKKVKPGWNAKGFAVSEASNLYTSLDITGLGARMVLAQGTGVDLDTPSRSAAVMFGGHIALLVRYREGYRLLVETFWVTYYTSFFKRLNAEA